MNKANKEAKKAELLSTIKGLRFGIEIETTGVRKDVLASTIHQVVGGSFRNVGGSYDKWEVTAPDGRKWVVLNDGSLTGNCYGTAGEITSPILTWADLEQLQDIVRKVREVGARVDHSCGIHIHVDGARFKDEPSAIRSLVRLVYNRETFIEAALKLDARRRSIYCQPIQTRIAEGIRRCNALATVQRLWYQNELRYSRNPERDHYNSSRYHGVNLHSLFFRGTIEFRWFNGSLHAGEVKSYVHLVLSLAATALVGQVSGKRREFSQECNQKRTFNWMLKNLGLDGEEFKVTRQHLTKHLPDNTTPRTAASFNGGVAASQPPTQAEIVEAHQAMRTGGTAAAVAVLTRATAQTDEEATQVLRNEDSTAHMNAARQRAAWAEGLPNAFRFALVAGCSCDTCEMIRQERRVYRAGFGLADVGVNRG
jgi:hypothetical protein